MKKIALAIIVGLLIQTCPMKASASYPISGAAAAVAAVAFGFLGGTVAQKQTPKTEFEALNTTSQYNNLLSQTAGGSLNTLDILK